MIAAILEYHITYSTSYTVSIKNNSNLKFVMVSAITMLEVMMQVFFKKALNVPVPSFPNSRFLNTFTACRTTGRVFVVSAYKDEMF
jgi:hypothetical protein